MKLLTGILIAIVLSCTQGLAQDKALLQNDGKVRIDIDKTPQNVYEVDISALAFQSQSEALAYFKTVNTELAFYRPHPDLDRAILYLQVNAHPEWNAEQWNEHLAEKPLVSEREISKTKAP